MPKVLLSETERQQPLNTAAQCIVLDSSKNYLITKIVMELFGEVMSVDVWKIYAKTAKK